MLVKIFSLPFSSAICDFDDSIIREFIKGKEIISISEYHFIKNDIPYLSFVLKYFPHRVESELKNSIPQKDKPSSSEEGWKKLLTEADMGMFNILRDWRSQRSKKEGVPPYILFTNLQLALMVKKRPQSSAELMQIEGIGPGKSQKYGEDILAVTRVESIIPINTDETKTS